MNVLIVDNELEYYDSFRRLVQSERPQDVVSCVGEALEAYERLAAPTGPPFDLLVLDEEMGGGEHNGNALLRRLQEHPIRHEPAIIYITEFFDRLPVDPQSGRRVTLFLDKTSSSGDQLYRALLLVARQKEGAPHCPADNFGSDFLDLVDSEVEESLVNVLQGYLTLNQQRSVASLIRSFVATLRRRQTEWLADDVLEVAAFLAEGLCKVYGLPKQMVELVRRFYSVDEVLYTIPRYRDHFLHQLKVFLLGYCIVNRLNGRRRLEATVFARPNGMKLWLMASLFHDVGYPFEKIQTWIDNFILGLLRSPAEARDKDAPLVPIEFNWGALFARRYHWYHMERIADLICSYYGQADAAQRASARTNLLVALATHVADQPDHGLFSALVLQNFLRMNVPDDEVDSAVVSVALHSRNVSSAVRDVIGRPLTFREDPLSFMLMFCDTAQEWGRSEAAIDDAKRTVSEQALFDRLTWDESRGRIGVELRYAGSWPQVKVDDWKEHIFKPVLLLPSACWAADTAGVTPLSFSISYFFGQKGEGRRPLDELRFS